MIIRKRCQQNFEDGKLRGTLVAGLSKEGKAGSFCKERCHVAQAGKCHKTIKIQESEALCTREAEILFESWFKKQFHIFIPALPSGYVNLLASW